MFESIKVSITGLALLSFLPESSFCFIRGNCVKRIAPPSPTNFYENYKNHWKNQREQNKRTDEEDPEFDYYAYEEQEPEINKRHGLNAQRPKRESDESQIYYDDASALPLEHRQTVFNPPLESRQSSRNPM